MLQGRICNAFPASVRSPARGKAFTPPPSFDFTQKPLWRERFLWARTISVGMKQRTAATQRRVWSGWPPALEWRSPRTEYAVPARDDCLPDGSAHIFPALTHAFPASGSAHMLPRAHSPLRVPAPKPRGGAVRPLDEGCACASLTRRPAGDRWPSAARRRWRLLWRVDRQQPCCAFAAGWISTT